MSEKSQLVDRLIANRQSRTSYTRSKVSINVASQIRALRRRRDLTQQALAQEAEMKQSRISAIERPGTRFNIETLVRLAAAFKVGLVVKFVPFSEMVRWENAFSQDAFNVVKIDEDWDFQKPEPIAIPVAFNMSVPAFRGKFVEKTLLDNENVSTTAPERTLDFVLPTSLTFGEQGYSVPANLT